MPGFGGVGELTIGEIVFASAPPPPAPFDDRANGIDRFTGTFIFPGFDYDEREANIIGMLAGTVLIQTQKQMETLGIYVPGSLPRYYVPP